MNPPGPSMFESFVLPMVIMLPVFYFLIIRPQSKRLKEEESFVTNLKRGDAVITKSGILGTIDGMTDLFVTLEVAPNTKIKMLKKQIAGSQANLEQNNKKQS